MTLRDLPFFGTTSEVMRCTKFLISIFNEGYLWLNRQYSIHVDDIYRLKGLSFYRKDFSTTFQSVSKHGKNTAYNNLYMEYGTHHKECGIVIYLINEENIIFSCYIIVGKIMRHYAKSKFSLDVISVDDVGNNGV